MDVRQFPHFSDFAEFTFDQMLNSMQFRMFVSSSAWQHAILVVFENLFDQWYFYPDLNPYMYLSAPQSALASPSQAIITLSFASSQPSQSTPLSFNCHLCSRVFTSSKALAGHLSRGHRVLHPIQFHLGPCCGLPGLSATCRCCLVHFTTRARLLHHLRQCSQVCHDSYIAHAPRISLEDVESALVVSAEFNKKIRTEYGIIGTTPLTATIPSFRAPGPVWTPS